jgi:hemin uptake protein HemP
MASEPDPVQRLLPAGFAQERPDCPPPEAISSAALLKGTHTLFIEHEGTRYTLRVTRQNKLILTK